jgi:hypothetical protein
MSGSIDGLRLQHSPLVTNGGPSPSVDRNWSLLHRGFLECGYLKIDGLFHGTPHFFMDDFF